MYIFDFDGVIIRRDVTVDLILKRFRKFSFDIVPVIGLLALSLLLPSHSRTRARVNRSILEVSLRGISEFDYVLLRNEVVHDFQSNPDKWNQTILQEMRKHPNELQIVSSGAEISLLTAVLNSGGLRPKMIFGSLISFESGRARMTHHNVQGNKLQPLMGGGIELQSSTFYSDSASDLEALLAAGTAVLVNPSKSLFRRVNKLKPKQDFRVLIC